MVRVARCRSARKARASAGRRQGSSVTGSACQSRDRSPRGDPGTARAVEDWRDTTHPGEDAGMSHGAYSRAHRLSLEDPEGFWAEAAGAVDWVRRPRRVLDDERP